MHVTVKPQGIPMTLANFPEDIRIYQRKKPANLIVATKVG
jgi:hypothetical protein